MVADVTIIGAGQQYFNVSGRDAGSQGIVLAAGQVQNIRDAPFVTE